MAPPRRTGGSRRDRIERPQARTGRVGHCSPDDHLHLDYDLVRFADAGEVSPKLNRTNKRILSPADIAMLFQSIDTSKLIGFRGRALIPVMFYSFGRVSAVKSK